MTSYGTGRRICLEVELPGGVVAVTVADPSVELAAAVNRLIDELLRGQLRGETVERVERPTSAPAPGRQVPDRVCPTCNAGPFASGHLLGAHKRSKHPTTPVAVARQLRALEVAGTSAAKATAELAATMREIQSVTICACGHAERLHKTDDEGRGECWYGNCDCTEYRAEDTA